MCVWVCVRASSPCYNKLLSFQRNCPSELLFNAVALVSREHLSRTSVTDIECTVHTHFFLYRFSIYFFAILNHKGCDFVTVTILLKIWRNHPINWIDNIFAIGHHWILRLQKPTHVALPLLIISSLWKSEHKVFRWLEILTSDCIGVRRPPPYWLMKMRKNKAVVVF